MQRASLILLLTLAIVVLFAGCSGRTEHAGTEKAAAEATEVEAVSDSPEAEVVETPTEVSFAAQVAPIFAAKCNACHHPDNAVKVDLTQPFDPEVGIINRPNSWTRSSKSILVVPGDAGASALIWKVEQTELDHKTDGDPMPWHIDPLTAQELEDLRQWILQGAEDDSLYRNSITRIFGDGVSLGSRGGKCAYCHYPDAAFGPDLTDPFDPNGGAVGAVSVFGGVRIVPGDPEASVLYTKVKDEPLPPNLGRPMPLHLGRLTPEERQTLRDWISEGAKNN
jgi:mono/diheme cytochrome c family protein